MADDLTVAVYQCTKSFPREELYGLTSQLRRAVSSVPANIAEGSNRASKKDYLRFLSIASGSLAETKYFLHPSCRPGYLAQTDFQKLSTQAKETSKALFGLSLAVEKELMVPSS